MQVFTSAEELKASVGQEVGVSEWHTIDQQQIDLFADATGDHQWIHVDPERALSGPYGTTIAHGYLTLSLLAPLMKQTYRIDKAVMALNYGLNKVRFPAPVKVGSRVRARVTVNSVEELPSGVQTAWGTVVEVEGAGKPACVAESVTRHSF